METLKRFVCSKIRHLILTAILFFGSPGLALSINPTGLAYTPDSVIANGDTLYILSRSNLSIFRWSVSQQQYIDTIELAKFPMYMTYSAPLNRLYLAYSDKQITKIDLGVSLAEQAFITLAETPLGVSTAGPYLFICDSSGSWDSHLTYDPDGALVSHVDWNRYSEEFIWSDANQKMYFFRDHTTPNDIIWEDIGTDGTIGTSQDSPYHGDFRIMHPIRVAPDGSVVLLGSGDIYDAITLEQIDSLANDITDAVWVNGVLYTTRDFGIGYQIQKWGSNYAMAFMSIADNFFKQEGIPYLDISPYVLKKISLNMDAYIINGDGHPNEKGHRLIANTSWQYFIKGQLLKYCHKSCKSNSLRQRKESV